jgi:hypothetical protein
VYNSCRFWCQQVNRARALPAVLGNASLDLFDTDTMTAWTKATSKHG